MKQVLIRLDDEVHAALVKTHPTPKKGVEGGVSWWIRCLVYRELGLPDPVPRAVPGGDGRELPARSEERRRQQRLVSNQREARAVAAKQRREYLERQRMQHPS